MSRYLRTPLGRLLLASLGVAAVGVILAHTGPGAVLHALERSAPFFPMILFLELAILACSVQALRTLYSTEAHKVPYWDWVRAGLVGYAVMGLVPAGRAVAEGVRAAMLSRRTSGALAAVAAIRMQALVLVANAAISIPAALTVLRLTGISILFWLISANFAITASLGLFLWFKSGRSGLGRWMSRRMGKHLPVLRNFGSELDTHLGCPRESLFSKALAWEFCGRLLQVLQNAVLVCAVGGSLGLLHAFCSEALHLVGAAAGDLIPAQVGATEMSFHLAGAALGIHAADLLCIPLLAHAAQLFWIVIGSVVPLVGQLGQRLQSAEVR